MKEGERRVRLVEWLGKIYSDVQDLLVADYVFWEFQKIVDDNPRFKEASGLFTEWMASNFINATAVGVRRHAKGGDDTISMKRFLDEVESYPALVSRAYYRTHFVDAAPWLKESGEHDFDRLAGAGIDQIPVALVQRQKADLARSVQDIEHYVDRRIAHYDKRHLARPVPALGDMTKALAVLEKLVMLYWLFLKGSSMATMLPTIQFDWQDIFRFTWAQPAAASREIT
jgi:hypothetical protein